MMDPLPPHDTNGFHMPQIPAPPLMNPPPQIFGQYSADGLPLPASVDGLPQQLFGDGTLLDESNEAKRRRIARVRKDMRHLEGSSWERRGEENVPFADFWGNI